VKFSFFSPLHQSSVQSPRKLPCFLAKVFPGYFLHNTSKTTGGSLQTNAQVPSLPFPLMGIDFVSKGFLNYCHEIHRFLYHQLHPDGCEYIYPGINSTIGNQRNGNRQPCSMSCPVCPLPHK